MAIEGDFSPATKIWPGIDLVILGGETGPGARPVHPDWVRSVRNHCRATGVPLWFKGWGKHVPAGQEKGKIDGEIIQELPG